MHTRKRQMFGRGEVKGLFHSWAGAVRRVDCSHSVDDDYNQDH